MQETKDPTIRLFGKKIQLPVNGEIPAISGYDSLVAFGSTVVALEDNSSDQDRISEEDEKASCRVGVVLEEQEADEDSLAENPTEINKPQDNAPLPATKESTKPETSSETNENPKTPSIDKETATLIKTPKTEKELNDTMNSQEKTLKKPDKILPCPRCNSMDTKFCYYNNYNVNQPRHFCKNCQRYWTAGGTMRNVPVGAGRRKNKNTSTHYRHIMVSEALQAAQIDAPNGIHRPSLKTNGTVLAFGSGAPLCESMSSVLNLAEKRALNGTLNGFHKLERGIPVPCKGGGENGDDRSSGSSVTASNLTEEGGRNGPQEPMMRNLHGFPSQIPCLPGVPWPYSWNSAVPLPAFCPPGFPMPFYPAPYWNGTIPGAWNMPWLPPPSSFTNQNAPSSGPNSPTLGKHSRDGNMLEPRNSEEVEPPKQNSERCIWVPKTLRIDDPDEAARSSIWATLGIKNDKADSISGVGLFKAFQSKRDEKNHIAETSPVLWANPAALSRSLNFQESS